MTVKIDHRMAHMPPPSEAMLDAMARAGAESMREWFFDAAATVTPSWDEMSSMMRDGWRQSARSMYGTLAKAGGGHISHVKEPEK